jgi:hypothetical protein
MWLSVFAIVFLYVVALGLLVYIIQGVIKTKNFSLGDALAALGIIITILVAPSLNNILSKAFSPFLPGFTSTPEPISTPIKILPLPTLSLSEYGALLYEDNFDQDTGVWSLEKGSQIQNGMLIIGSQTSTGPSWHTQYSDFVFETEFQFINPTQSGWNAFSAYLRFTDPPCTGYTGNCSDQVAVSTTGIVAAWRPNGTDNYDRLLQDTYASAFNPNGFNKLTIIVKGGEFRIFLNNVFVRSFTDATYKSGIVVFDTGDSPVALNYISFYATP